MSKFVTVGAYNNPLEAHLAKGRLEVEGIPAHLAHEHHVWANWVYSQALGGVKVQVAAENAENAVKIWTRTTKENLKSLWRRSCLTLMKTFAPGVGPGNSRVSSQLE